MPIADDFADLGNGLFQWQAYDSKSKVDLSATAAVTGASEFVFIDPIALRAEAMAELLAAAGQPPTAILLTNANHARAAEKYRRTFNLPVFAAATAEQAGIPLDGVLADPAGTLRMIPLPGAAPGEAALYRPGAGGTVIVGDALINLGSHPFSLLPDRYCDDPAALRRSLAHLLEFDFERMLFAHGDPIMIGAKTRLAALLHS